MTVFVKCVYRVHPCSEMIEGLFDTTTGRISGAEDLFKVDMSNILYYSGNYTDDTIIRFNKLYIMLLEFPLALAAIDYNGIGAIIVVPQYAFVYIYELKYNAEDIGDVPLLYYPKKVFDIIGEVRTTVNVYSMRTPQALIVVDRSDGGKYVYTKEGKLPLDVEYDFIPRNVPIDMRLHKILLKHPEWYGVCTSKGRLVPLEIVGNRICLGKMDEEVERVNAKRGF